MNESNELRSVTIDFPAESGNGHGCSAVAVYKSNVRSPPPKELSSLNNVLSESQSNLCNGSTSISINGTGLKKVRNGSPNGNRRPMISLTHVPKRPPVEIEFQDMSYLITSLLKKDYKCILKSVSGKFRPGDLTAIMGPSGAGKSTLMNILAGYKTSHLEGSLLINGKERNLRVFRKMSCYIMQDDCLTPNLSVREAMMVSANLKLGKDLTVSQKKVVIEEIMEVLGLVDCKNTFTSEISGGQRKRLSIALELVNNPPVMFFDEPTSGLDSSSSFQCISLLKSLARGGRTVICTIHQPSARLFEMFDYLYMLTDGQCIYKGSVMDVVPFLASVGLNCPSYHNPADYMIEVACGEHGDHIEMLVESVNMGKCNNYDIRTPEITTKITNDITKENTTLETFSKSALIIPNGTKATCTTSLLNANEQMPQVEKAARYPISGFQQFWILLKRTVFTTLRDVQLTRMRLVAHFVIGCLLGVIYYDIGNDASKVTSNVGCLFFTLMFTAFAAMMPTILTFPLEMSVFVREHLNYWYSLKAYYFAKTVADIPFQLIMTICYMMGVYYITSQPMEPIRFGMVILIAVLTALVSQSLGLLVGAACNLEGGVFVGPIASIPLILLSGFFVNIKDLPAFIRWLPHASYLKYSFDGIMISIYGLQRQQLVCNEPLCYYKYPTKFLKDLSMNSDINSYFINVGVLCGIFVVLRLCAYFLLRIKYLQLVK